MITAEVIHAYKSPQYEALAFGILRDRLVEIGYPQELKNFQYEPSFPVRLSDSKEGELKKQTVAKLDYYVEQSPELPIMLDKLRSGGRKVFLLTNSDFRYTQGIIRPWVSYFDYIVTDAHKPLFFAEGTILRAVDQTTGQCSIGLHTGPLEHGRVYAGGSCEVFSQLIGARSKEVLYTGDHIFGDILKSKKQVNWKTFLVIPELLSELYVWKKKKDLFNKLNHLENKLADSYMHLTITSNEKPDVSHIQKNIRMVAQEMDAAYGLLGSLFRHGSRLTYFSTQAMRYADLYSHSCFNLIYYPLCYMFRSPVMFMPHESTVSHEESPIESYDDLEAIPCGLRRRTMTSNVFHLGCKRV
ncbi:unnamed protein product [Schistocephalus solidus]|uniref:Cytosolic purine 5'-nucleotidase n=1 Tax=Schistocephalus solidus TaxID=70667 RepID=A0A183SDC7_SCHSO|nr:unnamed protein product [Schistocephalus solidus]